MSVLVTDNEALDFSKAWRLLPGSSLELLFSLESLGRFVVVDDVVVVVLL